MPSQLELSVIITTYQRPKHLERSLASLALQRGVEGLFEVVVADDGSQDRTHDVVHQFARSADFPVKLTTHPHLDYRVAMCRNDGARASCGQYLLFSDGDCVFPPEHLATHLRLRKPGVVMAGNSYRLTRQATERIDLAGIAAGAFEDFVTPAERRRLFRLWLKNKYYQLVAHPSKPKLNACDFGIWREDYERVNGFDEGFVGWGCEDDDLGKRLRRAGVRVETILRHTHVYHLWHPLDPTHPGVWREGANVGRLLSQRPIRCQRGLVHDEQPEGMLPSPAKILHFRIPRPAARLSRRGAEIAEIAVTGNESHHSRRKQLATKSTKNTKVEEDATLSELC
jgi:GT2 family glycosyltransferase